MAAPKESSGFSGDIWCIGERKAIKRENHWVIELEGPESNSGSWVVLAPDLWGWRTTRGEWRFRGQAPRFDDLVKCWIFVSPLPELGLYVHNRLVGRKIWIDQSDEIRITADTVHSLGDLIMLRKIRRNSLISSEAQNVDPGVNKDPSSLSFLIALGEKCSQIKNYSELYQWITERIAKDLAIKKVLLLTVGESAQDSENLKFDFDLELGYRLTLELDESRAGPLSPGALAYLKDVAQQINQLLKKQSP